MLTFFTAAYLRRVLVPVLALPLVAAAVAMSGVSDERPRTAFAPVQFIAHTDTIPAPSLPGAAGVSAAAMDAAGFSLEPVRLSFSTDRLLIPVAGFTPSQLINTFNDARSGGRVHQAIDIMAPRGTPVVAISDGRIARKRTNRLGGKVLYVVSPDGRYRFYYAHLDGYAPGIENGVTVMQGDTLGYVGDTGNARGTPPHLHFQVIEGTSRSLHRGRKVNPYTLFRRSQLYQDGRTRG